MSSFRPLAELPVDLDRGAVYEHGWQSWSPAAAHPVTGTGLRPVRPLMQTMCYRPGRSAPPVGFQGEGLLAVDPGTGEPVRIYAAGEPGGEMPSIRAELAGARVLVASDRPDAVEELAVAGPLPTALAAWADRFAARSALPAPLRAPTVWCSWYRYLGAATEADVLENLHAVGAHDLPVEVVQIDDGWQAEIGDWLAFSDRFASLGDLARRIRDAGRRAGLWLAPFLVGARTRLACDHPDWLVGGASAGHNWGQDLLALDVTHPQAAEHLRRVLVTLRGLGFDYFKLDFAYAGALEGRRRRDLPAAAAYREGLALIRDAAGPGAYLLGCGAPILPSVGLVDAMRVGPDIAPCFDPPDGDQSRPSQRAATLSVVGRAWQHGRFWVNDPDCLLLHRGVERRGWWARTVERHGGLRASADRIQELDRWGLATTRRLLTEVPPPVPFARQPDLDHARPASAARPPAGRRPRRRAAPGSG